MRKVPPVAELRKICEKVSERTRLTIQKRIMRFLSMYITKVLLYTPVTANQVTWIMMILGVVAPVLFFPGKYATSLAGAILLHFWYLMDHVDGEIARYRKEFSYNGYFLDYISLYFVHSFTFVFMTFGVYQRYPSMLTILCGFLIVASILLYYLIDNTRYAFFAHVKEGKITKESKKKKISSLKKSFFYKIMISLQKIGGKLNFLFSFDKIMILIFIMALINQLHLLFFFYGLVYPILIIFIVIYQYFFGINDFMREMEKKSD